MQKTKFDNLSYKTCNSWKECFWQHMGTWQFDCKQLYNNLWIELQAQ